MEVKLAVLDETIEKCTKGYQGEGSRGVVMGRVLDADAEAHIYIAALPRATPNGHGRYREIGGWKIC